MKRNILIAPDKFKGSLSATEAARRIAAGLGPENFTCRILPIADGGEGTAEAICTGLGGRMEACETEDALGRTVQAAFGWAPETGTAVVEMSQASGLWRLLPEEREPWVASTYGTGRMIRVAMDRGPDRLILGLGGSATNDGGSGMARALGYEFLDAYGRAVTEIPERLMDVKRIDPSGAVELPEVITACDVTNPLLGPEGATRVYGPQKGVSASAMARHEERLAHLADLVADEWGLDVRNVPGAGAAGGLGFGSLAFCGARMEPGFRLVAGVIGLEAAVREADAVITGEGNLDRQTLNGKGPDGVARLARRLGKPVVAVAGGTDGSPELAEHFDRILTICPEGMDVGESMRRGGELIEAAARDLADWIRAQIPG